MDKFGFVAVPRDPEKLLKGHNKESPHVTIEQIPIPESEVVKAVEEYVQKELSPETYNHSVRVFFYGNYLLYLTDDLSGQAIAKIHFPEWGYLPEVYLCLSINAH